MTDASEPEPATHRAIPATAGLCARCVHSRLILSGRGSRFVLCELSKTDPAFPRYPRLPVVACAGFEAAPSGDAVDA